MLIVNQQPQELCKYMYLLNQWEEIFIINYYYQSVALE